ncbi:MAG: hypothetical protein Q4Q04_00745 [Methanocorpusculum sp.]|nr:hypothetical protein [Methanocorpusculum sp.]
MTPRHQSTAIRSRKKIPAGLIVTIVIVLGIAFTGAGIGIFSMSQTVNAVIDSSEIALSCSVKGDDLIVELYQSGQSDKIVSLELVMDGYTLPSNYAVMLVPRGDYPKTITYPNVFVGIYNQQTIAFKAQFTDGSIRTVWMDTLHII